LNLLLKVGFYTCGSKLFEETVGHCRVSPFVGTCWPGRTFLMNMGELHMKTWKTMLCMLMAALLLVAVGCSRGANAPSGQEPGVDRKEGEKPVSLDQMGAVSLTMFKEDNGVPVEKIQELVSKRFPQVQLTIIKSAKGSTIDDIVASGQIPDILSYSLGGLWKLKDLQLLTDLTPFIETYEFDLNRYVDGVVDTVRSYSENGQILVLPFELNNNALFYNKDIFDKTGVEYPKDDMTWEQLYELTKKVVRKDGDTQIHGFHYNFLNLIYKNQLALPFVDPQTEKAAVNNDQWARWLQVMTSFYTIAGNQPPVDEKTAFMKNQNLAMRTGPNFMTELAASNTGMNWDVVSLPHFEGQENAGSQMNAPYFAIPPASKNKDAAFQVIQYLLSDEVAVELARMGRIPIMKSESIRSEFGKGVPGLEGKNLAAFLKDTIAKPAPQTRYDGAAKSAFSAMITQSMLNGSKDVNTALRELEEQINKLIEQEKQR